MTRIAVALIILAGSLCLLAPLVAEEDEDIIATDIDPANVTGLWRTPDDVLVEIAACEASVCGTVVWFPDLEKPGGITRDINNDDEALRTREIRGMTIIYGFEKRDKGWRKGRIYDPATGDEYKSKLTRLSETDLKVQGCVGPVCKKFIWTVAERLTR